jgi:hypothetical protein
MDMYEHASSSLNTYLDSPVLFYAKSRNFDFGPCNRQNVSNLSKFISHRIILEYDLVLRALEKHKSQAIEKFIQEIFWRVYWKGWLELRPQVWKDFIEYRPQGDTSSFEAATAGKTDIKCFDDWVDELKETNYLHNHTRMWFASIWIFTLKLPWQLGARFFLEHLYDGDAGSNTLSWRWVAGLQTKGKHYLAKPWNIKKYTNERYLNFQLNEQSQPLHEDHAYSIEPFPYGSREEKLNDCLLLTDNDLNFNNRNEFYNKYKRIFILTLSNEKRIIPISRKVLEFKDNAISSFKKYYPHVEICDNTFEEVAKSIIDFDVVYPFVGENLDYINQLESELRLNINFLVRREDSFCIPLCKKGFFDFKKNIPEIIKIIKN